MAHTDLPTKWKRWCDALSRSLGSRDGALLRTPKVIRQQAVKSILASIKMIRTKRLKDPQAVFHPAFKDGLHDSIRIESRSIRRLGYMLDLSQPVLPEKVVCLPLH